MITFLRGPLAHKGESPNGTGAFLVIDVQGVGYQTLTSRRSLLLAPPVGETTLVHTSLIVREDLMQLVGFFTREERELFDILSTASGVGAKVALALLSEFSVPELAGAIMANDHKRLTAAKGVGHKLAQKITIELKDKLVKWRQEMPDPSAFAAPQAPLPQTSAVEEAETVLLTLGYHAEEVYQALNSILKKQPDAAATVSSEELLQLSLKWLATQPA